MTAVVALSSTAVASARVAAQDGVQRSSLTNVSLRLDFFHSETHAPFFAAKDRGYWEKQGLDVTVSPGQGSASTVQQVAAGNDMFGWANAVAMTQQVSKGADVLSIGSMRQVFDGGIAFWPDAGINANNPKSLEGKTCAMTASGFIALLLPTYAQKTGLDLSKVTQRVLDPAVGNSLFGAHQVDCYESTVVQAKYFFPPRNGVTPSILKYSDVKGMAPLGFTIIANSRQLLGNPGLATKFLRGLIQGWTWACANPRAAVTNARTHFPAPAYDFEAGVNIWKETCGLERTAAAKGHPLGWMALDDWKDTVTLVSSSPSLGVTQNVPPASTLFTNKYVLQAWSTLQPKASGGGAAARATLGVTAGLPGEFRFKLSKTSVPHGKAVTLIVTNRGNLPHDFQIAGKKTPLIAHGKTARLVVTFKKAGRYPYLCTVSGHASAGMKGTLRVT